MFKSRSEIRQAQMRPGQIAFDALIKPWEINALDPALLFTTVYIAITYGIYYSFFESFPIVFQGVYGFDLGELGLAFLAVLAGLLTAMVAYMAYFYFVADPRFAKMEPGSITPEMRLVPGLFASFCIPVGLFLFGKLNTPTYTVASQKLTLFSSTQLGPRVLLSIGLSVFSASLSACSASSSSPNASSSTSRSHTRNTPAPFSRLTGSRAAPSHRAQFSLLGRCSIHWVWTVAFRC